MREFICNEVVELLPKLFFRLKIQKYLIVPPKYVDTQFAQKLIQKSISKSIKQTIFIALNEILKMLGLDDKK